MSSASGSDSRQDDVEPKRKALPKTKKPKMSLADGTPAKTQQPLSIFRRQIAEEDAARREALEEMRKRREEERIRTQREAEGANQELMEKYQAAEEEYREQQATIERLQKEYDELANFVEPEIPLLKEEQWESVALVRQYEAKVRVRDSKREIWKIKEKRAAQELHMAQAREMELARVKRDYEDKRKEREFLLILKKQEERDAPTSEQNSRKYESSGLKIKSLKKYRPEMRGTVSFDQ